MGRVLPNMIKFARSTSFLKKNLCGPAVVGKPGRPGSEMSFPKRRRHRSRALRPTFRCRRPTKGEVVMSRAITGLTAAVAFGSAAIAAPTSASANPLIIAPVAAAAVLGGTAVTGAAVGAAATQPYAYPPYAICGAGGRPGGSSCSGSGRGLLFHHNPHSRRLASGPGLRLVGGPASNSVAPEGNLRRTSFSKNGV